MISIVIPTYNRAHLISRAIESVRSQHFTEWQLIVVDDGSTDNTAEVVRPFLNDSRIRYIRKENSGAAHTRNVGVQAATTEWITFLDSDDEALPEWLGKFADRIGKGAEIVSCGLQKYDASGKLIETIIPKQNRKLVGGQFTNGGVYILRKSLFEAVGAFDPDLKAGQHTELYFRIRLHAVENGIQTTVIQEPLIKIHLHTGYRIRSDSRAKYEGTLYLYNKHYNTALKSKKLRSLYESMIAYNAFVLKDYNSALSFGWKSFVNKPSKLGFKRLVRYILRIK